MAIFPINKTDLFYIDEEDEYDRVDTDEWSSGYTDEIYKQLIRVKYFPYSVGFTKWIQRDDTHIITVSVGVTDFGKLLDSQSNPYEWVVSNFNCTNIVDEQLVADIVEFIQLIRDSQIETILNYGGVEYDSVSVISDSENNMKVEIIVDKPQSFNSEIIDVAFQPRNYGSDS